jgi:hypothetical protein
MVAFQHDDGGRKAAGYKGSAGDCVTRAIAIAAELPYREVYDALAAGNAAQRASFPIERGRFGFWRKSTAAKQERMSKSRTGVRTARNGIFTKRKWFKEYMERLGFEWTPTRKIGSGCTVHLKPEELPKTGRLVLSLSGHLAAYIDGVLHDTEDCSRQGTRCVYGYWTLQQ